MDEKEIVMKKTMVFGLVLLALVFVGVTVSFAQSDTGGTTNATTVCPTMAQGCANHAAMSHPGNCQGNARQCVSPAGGATGHRHHAG